MKLLVDTHAFLWLVEGSPRLSATARIALSDPNNLLFLSAASIWELAIKIGNAKLSLRDPLDVFVFKWTGTYQLDILPVRGPHATAVLGLPAVHRDPFDRMLVAQAASEGITLLSGDAIFSSYAVPVLW